MGTERQSPVGTIGENVNIEIVDQSYTPTYGVAVRAETVDRDALRVDGIVRGVSASLTEPETGSERQLRRSNLSIAVVDKNSSHATLRVELRDNQTGEPIVLDNDGRLAPFGGDIRNGYITVDDRRLVTNESGVALLTVDSPGLYSATYHPGSWLSHNPAYVRETATARWHPLGTLDSWFGLIFNAGWQLIPFFVMFYAGHRLLRNAWPGGLLRIRIMTTQNPHISRRTVFEQLQVQHWQASLVVSAIVTLELLMMALTHWRVRTRSNVSPSRGRR